MLHYCIENTYTCTKKKTVDAHLSHRVAIGTCHLN